MLGLCAHTACNPNISAHSSRLSCVCVCLRVWIEGKFTYGNLTVILLSSYETVTCRCLHRFVNLTYKLDEIINKASTWTRSTYAPCQTKRPCQCFFFHAIRMIRSLHWCVLSYTFFISRWRWRQFNRYVHMSVKMHHVSHCVYSSDVNKIKNTFHLLF